ncbi:unnamed protein product [Enterobius vermicularis]|uniref:Histidine acid phosphatase family protein n=1 Tax=Enterobius vermicularis TaxID=51028 RepID=A0A0N4UU13_ENTVE|nr:unnamed protein product [Enterobius vermicularis]
MLLLSSVLSVAYIIGCFADEQRELVYVQAIWRHGDRAPNKLPYPNDMNTEEAWPRGWSQLTNVSFLHHSYF